MAKIRLDQYLVENQMVDSRQKAQAYIMAGDVYVNGQKADKAGLFLKEADQVELRGAKIPYVSRGGLKLEKAMDSFSLELHGKICMDVGASTGGFTDCMLQNGASKVYALDVGYGQLAWKLRSDPRVVNLERTNIRYLTTDLVPDLLDFVSIDVSFISLTLVLPVVYQFLKENGQVACLIKPQFEAGKDKVGKKGVVREESTHAQVISKIVTFADQLGFTVKRITFSPVKGPEGNIEYLAFLEKNQAQSDLQIMSDEAIAALVSRSHVEL